MQRVRTHDGVPLGEHIAAVASELFYKDGIHVVGVDRVAAEAEVTKRTLYRYYGSKDDLIAAALRKSPNISFPREGSPRERIAGAFRAMAEMLRVEAYRGCPYINAAAELTNPKHPARALIEQLTTRRREWFAKRARELGAREPEMLAEQLDVLFDGALANATKRRVDLPARAALAAAEALLDAAAPAPARGAAPSARTPRRRAS
jgi:AcrR family transcriptional regulator